MTAALPGRTGLRSSKQYARVDGVWYESAHVFKDDYPRDVSVKLYSPATGEEFRVAGSEIEAMEQVSARVQYRGLSFLVNSFWSNPGGPDWRDPERGRIRGSVLPGSADCFAYIMYRGPDGRTVAEFPGATIRDEWPPSYDEVTLTIPVSKIEGYTEQVSAVPPKEH